jgi:hypothetical protein
MFIYLWRSAYNSVPYQIVIVRAPTRIDADRLVLEMGEKDPGQDDPDDAEVIEIPDDASGVVWNQELPA